MMWLRSRLFRKPESGQGTIEYLGVAVLISVLIAALVVAPVAPTLGTAIKDTVCKVAQPVLGGSCNSSEEKEPTPEDYMMECPVLTQTDRRGSEVDIAYVTLGGGTTLKVTKMSDGTAEVQLIGDATLGANFEAGKAELGDWVKLNAGVGLNITGSMGDTWKFDSWEAADRFAEDNRNRVESGWNYVPVVGPLVNKHNAPKDPQKTTYAVDYTQWANADAGFDVNNFKKKAKDRGNKKDKEKGSGSSSDDGSKEKSRWKSEDYDKSKKTDSKWPSNAANNIPDLNKWIPKGAVSVDSSKKGSMEIDHGENLEDKSDDKRTFTFDVKNNAQGSVKGFGGDAGANGGTQTSYSIETDADGNVTGMKMVQSVQGGAGTGDAKDDNTSKVFVADFDLSDPESRETVLNFMQNPGGIPNLEDVANGKLIGETPEQKAMADYLQSPNVKLNDMTIKNTNDADGFGLGVKVLGVGLGYDNENSSNTAEVIDSNTWVADDNGGRKRVKNTKCQ